MPETEPEGGSFTFRALDLTTDIQTRRRILPHWTQEGCTYFVTFHLADALPQEKLTAWRQERETWLRRHPHPWSIADHRTYQLLFTERIDRWLDAGEGSAILAQPPITALVESALRYFDGVRYTLDWFSIMPTHGHVLLLPYPAFPLRKILHSLKSFTAHRMNDILGLEGQRWFEESFDHAVRSWEQLNYYRRYIQDNPQRAHLPPGTYRVGTGRGIELEQMEAA